MTSDQGHGGPRIEPRFRSDEDDVPVRDDSGIDPFLEDAYPAAPRRAVRGRLVGVLAALAALGAFAGIAWYATVEGQRDPSSVVPVITADDSPVKLRPQDPGGLEVPNRDKLVYDTIGPEPAVPRVERLLLPPETPADRPEASDPAPSVPAGPLAPDREPTGAPAEVPVSPAPPKDTAEPADTGPGTPPPDHSQASAPSPRVAQAGAFRVQLAAVRDAARARAEAARLAKAHDDVLGGLDVGVERADLGSRGVYYRLRAGPLPDRRAADALCGKLAARKVGCMVVAP
jgi:hypothetical protein